MKMFRGVTLVALAVLAVTGLAFAGQDAVAKGKVTAVSDTNVTLTDEQGSVVTFQVAPGAKVSAWGAGRKGRALAANGKPTTMDDFVREGQNVTVNFREQDGTRYITKLRVL